MTAQPLSEKAAQTQPADEKSVAPHLRCNSCSKPVFNSYQTPHGCRLCQSCVSSKLHPTEKRLCPGNTEACRDEEEEIHISQASCVPDIATRREISKLLVTCPNKDDGCREQLKWRDVDAHLDKCDFEKVPCDLCRDSILKKKLTAHLSDECRQRKMKCDLCSQMVVFSEMDKSHKNLDSATCCTAFQSICPHCKDKSKKMKRPAFVDHLRVCPEKPNDCKYGENLSLPDPNSDRFSRSEAAASTAEAGRAAVDSLQASWFGIPALTGAPRVTEVETASGAAAQTFGRDEVADAEDLPCFYCPVPSSCGLCIRVFDKDSLLNGGCVSCMIVNAFIGTLAFDYPGIVNLMHPDVSRLINGNKENLPDDLMSRLRSAFVIHAKVMGVELRDTHYNLLCIDLSRLTVSLLNPRFATRCGQPQSVTYEICASLNSLRELTGWPQLQPHAVEHPRQTDSSSCGVMCCWFAACLAAGNSIDLAVTPEKTRDYRETIWNQLLAHRED